jgi:hypothetical protein
MVAEGEAVGKVSERVVTIVQIKVRLRPRLVL